MEIKITDIAKQDGVKDLPIRVRSQFALALKAEMQGDHEKAESRLNKACEAEEALETE